MSRRPCPMLLASPLALPYWHDASHAAELAPTLAQQGYALASAGALAHAAGTSPADLATLARTWDDLPPDEHLRDGGRYRRRRHGSFVQDTSRGTLLAVPHRPHWQPTTYNALHGGMLRWFAPLDEGFAASAPVRTLLTWLGQAFAQAARLHPPPPHEPAFDGRWFIEAHAFRIDTASGVGRPTPEGAHRDGVAYVAVILVDRQGIVGGETRVFQAQGPQGLRFTLTEPWSALLLDDARVIHESTPIQTAAQAPSGWRDTLVLTYRAGSFQDPPSA